MNEKLKRDAAAKAAARTLAYYLTFGYERDGQLWDNTNEDEIAAAVENIVSAAVHQMLTDSDLNKTIAGLQQRVADVNQAFKVEKRLARLERVVSKVAQNSVTLPNYQEAARQIEARINELEQAVLRGGAARKRLDALEAWPAAATSLAAAIPAYLRARERRQALEWALQQARARQRQLFGEVRRLALAPDMQRPPAESEAYFSAREKRAELEEALQQARARESQLSADVRRLAPGPGMYRVGDDYVLVTHDEVYPAAPPVEVSS